MADRYNNLGNTDRPDESDLNPDLGRDENSGLGGSNADRGSDIDRDENIPAKPGDGGKTETSGDELGESRERGRSGSGSGSQSDGQGDSQSGSNGNSSNR